MKEISITGFGLSRMCRLCLSSCVTVLDLFSFSTKFGNHWANAVMQCAPVQIRSGDEMPNFICQKCQARLEKTYQFQMQIIESEKTLQRYLEQLHAFDKKPKLESSIQKPSESPLIENTEANIAVKCESLELHELVDLKVNCREKEYENSIPTSEISIEMSLKSEIKDEPMDDCSLILTEFTDDTVSEINCEDTKVGFGLISENSANQRSSDVEEYFEKFEKRHKNTSMDIEMHKKAKSVKSHQFKINDTCKKRYVKSRFLETHKSAHTSKKLNRCDICKKCFTQSSNLNTHKLIHSGEKPYQCDICKKCFTRSSSLNTHKLIHSGEKPYQCDICKKCFTQSSSLNAHKLIHTGEKPYQCDICKKCFNRSDTLNTHKLIHSGEKPYQCDICKKCFTQSSSLNVHKLIHTGEKPYQCDICKKCFNRSDTLNTHKLIHSGEKPYQCDICKKCFTQSSSLNAHKLIHSGEKAYQCDICKKCFTHSNNLNRHKLIHTDNRGNSV